MGDTPGGLIGYDDGSGTLTNNWWYNSTNAFGVGTGEPGAGQVDKATAASDFFDPTHAVYTGATWDFNGLWVSDPADYPHLIWQDMGDGSAFIGGTSTHPFQISDVNQLQFMSYALASYFELINNINASATSAWNGGDGFVPIGDNSTNFTGALDGNNHTIDSLFINRPAEDYVGLFGYTDGSTIQNVGLTNVNVTGTGDYVGG